MKKIFYFLILILFSFKAYSESYVSFGSYSAAPLTNGNIVVSNTTATSVNIVFSLSRGFGGYNNGQFDPVDFRYSIVYVKGSTETVLKAETTITQSKFGTSTNPSQGIYWESSNVSVPAGSVGGYVKVKYKYYEWNFSGGTWRPSQGYTYNTGTPTVSNIPPTTYTEVEYGNYVNGAWVPYPTTLPILGFNHHYVTQGYTYPNNTQNVSIQWDSAKLPNSSNVKLILYKIENEPRKNSTYGYGMYGMNKVATGYQVIVPNNGAFQFNLGNIGSQDANYDYFFRIESQYGNYNEKYFNTGVFTFTNDQPVTKPGVFYPIASWVTVAQQQDNGTSVTWMANKLNANNVRIDFYNADGTFNSNITLSTPNTGHFNAGVPPGEEWIEYENYGNKQYVLKISSVENPNEFGYSTPFWIYIN